ncbi:MAG: AMP-binding protein [Cellulomonadaceae bacterium]
MPCTCATPATTATGLPATALVSGEPSQATEAFRAARDLLLARREDYDAAVADFTWPELTHFNYALDWFDVVATEPATAERVALWLVEEDGAQQRLTYADLREHSNRAANWFRELGVERGDRVLLVLGNQVELWVAALALIKIGAVMMPTTTLAGAVELSQRITLGGVRAVVARAADTARYGEIAAEVLDGVLLVSAGEPAPGWTDLAGAQTAAPEFTADAPTRAHDPLFLYYTSGTTAEAKLVEHSHVSYTIGHLSTMYWVGVQPGDVHLNISSPGWGKHAWSNFFAPFHAGATVFLFNYHRFDAQRLLAEMGRAGVSSFCAPPTVWRMLIQADLTRLTNPPTTVVGAGEPLNPEVISQVRDAWGVTIRDGYGQTETTLQIGNTPGQEIKPGSMGRPAPGYPVVLVDPDSGELVTEPGRHGEICLDLAARPLGLTNGYRGDDARTAEAMRDGYYHSSDVAWADEDGYITYVGRTDDVFKASDYRISPFELESALLEHPWVREAAVVPSPDPLRLAVPKAYVSLVDGVVADEETARSLFEHSRARLSPYKRIRRLTFTQTLPKTISEKIRRVELRALEREIYDALADGAVPEGEFRG